MIFERLADVIWKRSKLIIAIWIILLICAVPGILKAGSILDYSTENMAGPDAESIDGAKVMAKYFGGAESKVEMDAAALLIVGFNDTDGSGMTNALGLYAVLSPAGDGKVPGYVNEKGDQKILLMKMYGVFSSAGNPYEGVAVFAIIYDYSVTTKNNVIGDTSVLREFIGKTINDTGLTGIRAYVTGAPALEFDTSEGASQDISKIDVFSVLMILILVGLFFRSFVTSAMPPMTIGAAFGIAMCLMFFVGSIMEIMYMTEMILLVSMLGAGCDYCIFILARYREERVRHGQDHEQAFRNAITWAGESITTSGLAVVIGFGAMSICSFGMISSMGIMLAIGIVVALLAALTLISAVLALFGDKLFWPTKSESLREGGKADRGWHGKVSRMGHRYFIKSVKFSLKNAKYIIITAVLLTIPAAYIMATTESSYDMVGAMSTGEGMEGIRALEQYSNGGMMSPNYAIYELSNTMGTINETAMGGSIQWATAGAGLDTLKAFSVKPAAIRPPDSLFSKLLEDDNVGEVWGVYQWKEWVDFVVSDLITIPMSDHDYTVLVYSKVAQLMSADASDTLGKQLLASFTSTDPTKNVILGYEAMSGSPAVYNDPLLIALMDYVVNYMLATSVGGIGTEPLPGVTVTPITFVKYTLITKDAAMADRSIKTIKFMDRVATDFANANPSIIEYKWLTGGAVVMFEISEMVAEEFLKVEIIAVALIFVLLFFVMRSYVTPIRSILTILMSVVWTVAMTHLLFEGLLGEGVIWMIPIILIVVCLGLGMDYDILLTTRIKENRLHKGMTNDEAITHAVTHSGSVITICGLIMGSAFGTLMLSSTSMLQEFGFALCFAILVDALLVRTYVVPAAMHLLGDLNWKGPKILHKKFIKTDE